MYTKLPILFLIAILGVSVFGGLVLMTFEQPSEALEKIVIEFLDRNCNLETEQ